MGGPGKGTIVGVGRKGKAQQAAINKAVFGKRGGGAIARAKTGKAFQKALGAAGKAKKAKGKK